MPALARFGLILLASGLFADLAAHASGSDGTPEHLVVFIGMLLVVSGVVHQGLRSGNVTPRRGTHVDAHR